MGMLILCLCFIFMHFRVQCSSFGSFSPHSPHQLCLPEERSALLEFMNSINCCCLMQPWDKNTDCCSWDGVTCDKLEGHVIGLDVSRCYGLEPQSIPTNSSLFRLEKLQQLNLSNFDLSYYSTKPFGFRRWKSLTHLTLASVGLSGSLMLDDISQLPNLETLDLSNNSNLHFDDPKFRMLVHNLTKLKFLGLSSVDMSLVVPGSLLNCSSSLEQLSLAKTNLQGDFPIEVLRFPSLQHLDLSYNANLGGHLPKSNWSNPLKYLDLRNTSFSGELPSSMGNLKLLQVLFLTNSKFSGSIPASLANLTKITTLVLGDNHLEGQIPNIFGKMHNLSYLDFKANNFWGELPASIFNLTELSYLYLSSNQLTGPLPKNVSGLSLLSRLSMHHNLLEGGVPSWLFSLSSLEFVDLNHNRLTGPIDDHIQPSFNPFIVYLSNNKISSSIPDSFFNLVNLVALDISSNNLSGTLLPSMLSKLDFAVFVDFSDNSLLSLSNNGTGVIDSFSFVVFVFSSCNLHEFPSFLMRAGSLTHLDLSKNKIAGQIHKWQVEGMSLSSLNLSYNFLTGVELSGIQHLMTIDLRSNKLQGSLPIPLLSGLMHFFISGNNLIGEIPSSLCNLTSLVVLDLSWNNLEGGIPECLGIFSDLSVIDLRMNKFLGRIPNSFANTSSLRTLNLNGNQLEGRLPPSLVNCISMEVLDIGNNYLNDTFPHWLAVLPSLKVLILRSNRFHGPISNPMTTFSFSQLRIIDISQNEFIGVLPTKLFQCLQAMRDEAQGKIDFHYIGDSGNYYQDSVIVTSKGLEIEFVRILTIFTAIDFSGNRFHGQIPEELGELKSLLVLNFSHNSLIGHIPSRLGKLVELESLDLSSNKLEGRIPEQLTSLTFLSVLNLSHNKLVGYIPQGKQFNTFSNDSYFGNSGLCGLPLTRKCHNGEEPEARPSEFEDEFAALFDWKFAMAGYGCGLVLGISLAYIVFTTGKPWWLVKKVEVYQQKFVRRCNRRHKSRKTQKPNQRS